MDSIDRLFLGNYANNLYCAWTNLWRILQIYFGRREEIIQVKLDVFDKIIALFGFGRPWFFIRSWSDTSKEQKYAKLYRKHKIFELMYESFATVALQLYVSLVSNHFSLTIFQSLLASFLSISYSVLTFLMTIIRKDAAAANQPSRNQLKSVIDGQTFQSRDDMKKMNGSNAHSSNRIQGRLDEEDVPSFCKNFQFFGSIYLFMFTDFYLRCFPIIGIVAAATSIYESKVISFLVFCVILIPIAIFDFIMIRKMRQKYEDNDNWKHIASIFMVSILSSFHSLLSSLSVLTNNQFLRKSADFKMTHLK